MIRGRRLARDVFEEDGLAGATPERIMQVGLGVWASKALLTAVELGLFTELARGPLDGESLRERLGLHRRSARDFFDALVAVGFLERDGDIYRNAPDSDLFLDAQKPSYVGGILSMSNQRLYPFWGRLTEALRTGQPQNETRDGVANPFEAIYADAATLKGFLSAMTGISRGANLAIAADFPWDRYRTFVDIGTAQGDTAVQIALAHPHLTGTGFDLPQVGPLFEDYVRQNKLSDRLRFAAGSFFTDELPHADVITMGHILHDWSIDEKQMLIVKAYNAIPDGGALIVYDSIIDDDRRQNAFGLLMSLNMLIETPGGFDYTGRDCIGWLKGAGFREAYVQPLVGPDSMAIGIK
jgi:hypothetical protein